MTSDGASLAALIARLETVAQRLESVKGASSGGDAVEQPSETTHTQPASPAAAAHQDSTVADWDAQIAVLVNSLAAAGDGIGAEVPDAAGLQQLVQATGQQLMAANEIADNRRSPAFNHAKAAAEALQGLTWVIYTGPNCGMSLPAKHVAESWQSAEFYANKVLMQHRQSGLEHVQWVQLLKQLLQALGAYVQQHHKAGPAWRPNGTTVAEFLASGPPAGEAQACTDVSLLLHAQLPVTTGQCHAVRDGLPLLCFWPSAATAVHSDQSVHVVLAADIQRIHEWRRQRWQPSTKPSLASSCIHTPAHQVCCSCLARLQSHVCGATAAPASSAPAPSQPAPPSPPAAPPAPPAPPPPPPGGPGSLLKDAVAKQQQAAPAKPAAGGMSAVFSSINKVGLV
ncbi:hypothetical protein MMC07_006566 [Pseudocyphellaria aurata]|nr:hypothetical protein [Pseudocyphellaria aurata]